MRLLELVRTTSFRLAVTFLVLFSIAAACLFAFITWQTSDFVSKRVDEWLYRELTGLDKVGITEITARLKSRQENGMSLERSFSLFDASGQRLAGSDVSLPKHHPATVTPFDFFTNVDGHRLPYRGLVKVFDTGERLMIAQEINEQREFDELLSRAMMFGAIVTATLGLVGAGLIGAGSVRRIDRITQTAERIMHGDLSQRLPTGRASGDIDRLATVVNEMLDEIEHLMHEVKGVCDNIAHDMRTPLTRLLAGLERARRRSATADEYAASIDDAVIEIQGILKTFSALLRISEVEDGIRRSGFQPVSLASIAKDAIEFYEPFAEERGVDLALIGDDDEAGMVLGDASLLFEAISNLTDNAIKFTPEGGRATITLQQVGDRISLAVEDTGCGIPPEEVEAVLRRFHRTERSRHEPGNGLGLSLVSAIARLHGMGLSIEQPPVGCRIVLDAQAIAPTEMV